MMHSFDYCVEHIGDVGLVSDARESLIAVSGLAGAIAGEGVTLENGLHGMIVALGKQACDVLVFSRDPVAVGTRVARTGKPLSISVGESVLGRTVDAMGYVKSGAYDKSEQSESRPIDPGPPGIVARTSIRHLMETGVGIVDTLVPIGAGQRELIIGDRITGKTHFLLHTLLTQATMGTVIIYVAIGKRQTEIKSVEEFLRKHGIYDQCVLVSASAYDSPGEVFIAPLSGMTIAEYFRDQGKNSLLIFDDLTTHAKYYREFSLVLGSFPGRESYPGDVFHLHARLLERAGNFNSKGKDSISITCLPVVDSVGGDMTGYIQTNVMSMTDGHIFFDEALMAKGVRPAVNVFLSVTRVGRQTLSPLMRDIGTTVLATMKAYGDTERFTRFGSELTDVVKQTISRGQALSRLFSQTTFTPYPSDMMAYGIANIWNGSWDGSGAEKVAATYESDSSMKKRVQKLIKTSKTMEELVGKFKMQNSKVKRVKT